MCGIVSIVGDITVKEENIFKDMLQMDVIRGKDSTGVISVNVTGKVDTVKALGSPQELMDMRKFDTLMRGKHTALIGHNRAATIGGVTKNNAHPFQLEHITGVHNGTLRNKYLLPDAADFEVDSENLYHAISLNGLKETIGKVNGAYTLAYVDSKENTVNFLRNDERPLWFASSTTTKTQIFASERWMIQAACERREYKIGAILELAPHTLLSLSLNDKGIAKVNVEKDIPHYQPPPPRNNVVTYNKVQEFKGKVDGNTSATLFSSRKGALQKLLGKHLEGVLMSVVEPSKSNNFNGYATYSIEGIGAGVTLFGRVYIGTNHKEVMELKPKVNQHFTFKIKNVGTDYGIDAWGVIDRRSLKKGFLDDEGLLLGFRGKALSPREFREATNKGCSWCSCTVDERDSNTIEWISSNEFICDGCYHDDEVWEYLN